MCPKKMIKQFNTKQLICMKLLELVKKRKSISEAKPLIFSMKILDLDDEYKLTISREIRKLKAATLIDYKTLNKRQGTYELIAPGKYGKAKIERMLVDALAILEMERRPSVTRYVERVLNELHKEIEK